MNDPRSKFKKRSKWEPNQYQRDPVLETFLSLVGKDVNQHIPRAPRSHNLSQEERESLKTLANNETIVINKGDKESAVAVVDLEDYIHEAKRQLGDDKFYAKLSSDPTEKHVEHIMGILQTMLENDGIDYSCIQALSPSDCRAARFYFLPKIHKKASHR